MPEKYSFSFGCRAVGLRVRAEVRMQINPFILCLYGDNSTSDLIGVLHWGDYIVSTYLKGEFFFITKGFTFSECVPIQRCLFRDAFSYQEGRVRRKPAWVEHCLCTDHFLWGLTYVSIDEQHNDFVITFKYKVKGIDCKSVPWTEPIWALYIVLKGSW